MAEVVCRMCGRRGLEFTEPKGIWMCEPCEQRFANDFAERRSGVCAAEGGHPAKVIYPVPRWGITLCERHFRETMRKAVWPKGWP